MKRTILLACLLLGAAGLSASPVTMELLSFNGIWQNGYPYTVQLNNGSPLPAMCDDYFHGGTPGDIWLANLTNLGTGNLTNLRFASDGLIDYLGVAWILLETRVTPQAEWPDMNFAVWYIFNRTVPIDPLALAWFDMEQVEAQNGFPGVDFNLVEFGTPVNIVAPAATPQEYLWITPEPGSLILLGTGALGMFAVVRRRWKH